MELILTNSPVSGNASGGDGGLARIHASGIDSAAVGFAADRAAGYGVRVDQRGHPRPGESSTACDCGACEFQGNNADSTLNDLFEGATQ